jgi:hypothetical protein
MKKYLLPLLALAALLAAAPLSAQTAGGSGIRFKGFVVQGDQVKVCLVNLATNNAKWLPVGGKTGGYIIKSCAAKVMNPYLVLVPASGRGAETILHLDEVAAPISTPIILFDLPRKESTAEMPILSTGFLQHAKLTTDDQDPFAGHQPGNAVDNSSFHPLVTGTMTKEIAPRAYVAYDPSGSPPDVATFLTIAQLPSEFASDTAEKGLIADAIRARDEGNFATANENLELLLLLHPNSTEATRLREDVISRLSASPANSEKPVSAPAP